MATRTSEQPLKIAVLAETLNRGGAERQGYVLAEELLHRGHQAKVLSFWAPSKCASERTGLAPEFPGTPIDYVVPPVIQLIAHPYRLLLENFLKKFQRPPTGRSTKRVMNAQVHGKAKLLTKLLAKIFLGSSGLKNNNLFAELVEFGLSPGIKTRLLITYLQRHQCDLVISFLPDHNAFAILASREVKVPVVVSERNDVLRQPVSSQTQWTRSKLYPYANIITANTEFSVRQLKGYLPDSRVIWQPNKQHFSPDNQESKKFATHLYVIARLEPQKQIDIVIKALPILREPGFFPPLHIFGEGPDEPRLKSLVSELGLDTQVHFRGYIPNKEIFGQSLKPGLFISNSMYEGSSNSLHESVAAGLIPVVSETVSEIHSILRPELAESLFTNGTSEDMASKVYDLLQRQDLAQKIRAEVLADFNAYWNRREVALNQAMSAFIDLARDC